MTCYPRLAKIIREAEDIVEKYEKTGIDDASKKFWEGYLKALKDVKKEVFKK